MLLRELLLTTCISLATAVPLHGDREENHVLETRQSSQLLPGINFDYIDKECSLEQQEILRRVAISTGDFLQPADVGSEEHWAWHQYFLWVRPHGRAGELIAGGKTSRALHCKGTFAIA